MPTPTPYDDEQMPAAGFDALAFWDEHKSKVILYACLLFGALIAFAIYQISTQRQIVSAERAFAEASKPEDYGQISKDYPRTVVAGNATLMLAEKLRNEKKYDEAVTLLRGFIDQTPQYPLAGSASLSLGATLEAQGKPGEALLVYQGMTQRFTDNFYMPAASLAQASVLKSQGKLDEAKRLYESVISQFPESFFAREATRDVRMLGK